MVGIGIVGMGAMGSGIARALRDHGIRVVSTGAGRTGASVARARAAGVELLSSLDAVVAESEVFLSIVPPAVATDVAEQAAGSIRRTRRDGRNGGDAPIYADCNAVAPDTVRAIEATIVAAGARFADLAILGGPPVTGGGRPFMPASGEAAATVCGLLGGALDVREIGGTSGRASALKMCYAAMTKGGTALHLELLTAAERLGVAGELREYLDATAPGQVQMMSRALPRMVPKAGRWVAEMDEIAATFESVGLTPLMLRGAGDMYRLVSGSYQTGPGEDDAWTVAASMARAGTIGPFAAPPGGPAAPAVDADG